MFDELIIKVANGVQLSDLEKEQLRLEAKRLQDAASLINSIIKPGTSDLQIDRLSAQDVDIQNGNVKINNDGISMIAEGQLTIDNAYKFVDTSGNALAGYAVYTDANWIAGSVRAYTYQKNVPNTEMDFGVVGGYSQAKAQLFSDGGGGLGHSSVISVEQYGSNYSYATIRGCDWIMIEPSSHNPFAPSANTNIHVYLTASGKLVILYNDAGTARYKYLDLTGTTVTWVHSTTPPA